jgi:hypothetical protein
MLLVFDVTGSRDLTEMASHKVVKVSIVIDVANQVLQALRTRRRCRFAQRTDCESVTKK